MAAPLDGVAENRLLPSASSLSGAGTVTSAILPSLLVPALTVPSGPIDTSLGEIPFGSVIGGWTMFPSAVTSWPVASSSKEPSRVSAMLPSARLTVK